METAIMYSMDNMKKFPKMDALAPEAMKAFWAFDRVALADGAIPKKYKELMALAVALTTPNQVLQMALVMCVLGVGIGELAGQAFRIAHMGHVNAPMILGTLGVIEVALNALNIPHGKGGTEAAIEYLGESVSA